MTAIIFGENAWPILGGINMEKKMHRYFRILRTHNIFVSVVGVREVGIL